MKNILIAKITQLNLKEASALADGIFSNEDVPPSLGLAASCDPAALQLLNSNRDNRFNWLRYWVAIDQDTDAVVGTVGIYEEKADSTDSCWLGWYCVDPSYRGRHVGTMLIEFAIDQATVLNKHYLKVFTSVGDARTAAHAVYKKYGFEPIPKNQLKSKEANTIYLQKILSIA
ncbi:MAG: GNAT family N-acetyltransferase [bacterium]|nr:GNAT family N-acetyltransferase [bacterium]